MRAAGSPEDDALRLLGTPHEQKDPARELVRVRLDDLAALALADGVRSVLILCLACLADVAEHRVRVKHDQVRVWLPVK